MAHKELYILYIFLSTSIIYSLNAESESETEPKVIENSNRADHDNLLKAVQQSSSGCSSLCLICNSNSNPQTCSQCLPGYVVLTSGNCVACPNGCSLCEGTQTCTQCLNGYTPISEGYVSRCVKCSQGCQKCSFLQISGGLPVEATTCSTCFPGFYLVNQTNSISICVPCIPACTLCLNNQSCLKCAVGYGYNANQNLCYICQQNCLQCTPVAGCEICLAGFYLQIQDNTCQPCNQNCTQCIAEDICEKCSPGFYPLIQHNQTTNATTYLCLACPSQCQVCYNEQICLSCVKGNFLNITQQNEFNITTNQTVPVIVSSICQTCPHDCFACVYPGLCQSCQPGYFLNSDNNCQSCGLACYQCSSTGQCVVCIGSYYLSNGQCAPCNSLCSICVASQNQTSNQSICLNCTSYQYTPLEGQCVLCSEVTEGCLTCTSAFNCLSCENGYVLQVNGICFFENAGFGAVYIVMIVIACIIAIIAIIFAIYACWRYRNGYRMAGEENIPGMRASYYQIP